MSRSLAHLLLSLLLLVSQQLTLAHAYAHWGDARASLARAPQKDGGKPALQEQCGHCAASAQLAFALPATERRFTPALLADAAPRRAPAPGICLPTACPFQQRGPPPPRAA